MSQVRLYDRAPLLSNRPAIVFSVANPPGSEPGRASLDEERREVMESVMAALAGGLPDPDEMAACCYLLKHLADTGRRATNAAGRHL